MVEVRATNIAGEGVPGNADTTDQDYALVVSNAVPGTGPVLVHDLTTATEIGSADGDGTLEPGEPFRLSERLRNIGAAAATGVSGVLSTSQAGVIVTDPNSAYADIPAGGVRANSPAFRGRLRPTFGCGDVAEFTLDAGTAQGNFEIPVSVPTGGAGTPVNVNSSDVPKPIADNSTVDSTLVVSGAGTIQDLNVRIPNLVHTFDGDLEITLLAPGGSPTATLANNRGGSGDNFTNTVLDDEAATAVSAGTAPFTGSFRPETPLSVFDGMQQAGTWTLRVADQAGADTGTLNAWGLTKTTTSCD